MISLKHCMHRILPVYNLSYMKEIITEIKSTYNIYALVSSK